MKGYFLFKIFILMLFLIAPSSFASSSISLKQYPGASCDDYRGTWEGFASDPNNIFKNDGPWPILVHLHNQDRYIIGRSAEVKDIFKELPIWARCSNGRLRNIFWGEKGSCGRFSQNGLLVSKNVLVLELYYQNGKKDAKILLLLTRKSNTYPYSVPKEKSDFRPGRIKTCR